MLSLHAGARWELLVDGQVQAIGFYKAPRRANRILMLLPEPLRMDHVPEGTDSGKMSRLNTCKYEVVMT